MSNPNPPLIFSKSLSEERFICRLKEFNFYNDESGKNPILNIGDKAFYNSGLEQVDAFGTFKIGQYAFTNCNGLKKVYASGEIGQYAFSGCTHLEEITFNSTKIGSNAVLNSESLSKVNLINDKLMQIDTNAFYKCPMLFEIYVPGNPSIADKAIGYLDNKVNTNFVIFGDAGNTSVKSYANTYDIKYEDYDETRMAERIESRKLTGDIDGNGLVTVADAVKLQQFLLGKNPSGILGSNMDINGDSVVDSFDMISMRKLLIKGE